MTDQTLPACKLCGEVPRYFNYEGTRLYHCVKKLQENSCPNSRTSYTKPQWTALMGVDRDAVRYRWLRDPCSGAERVVMYSRGDYGRGLMSYTMLDNAIDSAMGEQQ